MRFNVVIETDKGSTLVKWGEGAKGWMRAYEDELAAANRITLINKDSDELITVKLDKGKEYVLFSRVYGKMNPGTSDRVEARLYCLGWKLHTDTLDLQSLNWIYPNGVVENADEPSFVHHYLGG